VPPKTGAIGKTAIGNDEDGDGDVVDAPTTTPRRRRRQAGEKSRAQLLKESIRGARQHCRRRRRLGDADCHVPRGARRHAAQQVRPVLLQRRSLR
jgi:hypothetical protein